MSNVFVFRQPPRGVITEYFGGGKGGSTTTTNNVTQIPPEVLARYNAVNARAETVAQQPYQAYSQDPNAFVAPLSQTQQAGIQNTNTMAGAAQPYYGAATGLAAQSTGSVNPSALNVGQYMNPFTQGVVNATQAALNQQQGQQLAQQQAEAIRGGAFGGDRANLQRAQLMGQQGLAQAQAIAPLYQQNYNQALAAAQQQQGVGLGAEQANRQNLQNAATLFGSIGTNAQQAGLAGAQAQLAAGQTQQQTQQAGLQALYNQFQQQQGFPYQQAQFLANIAEGTGALSGNATSGTSTTTGGGGFFSDERLKENIQRVGETDDGQPIYRYNYKGDKNTQIGLLAQDVEKHHPEAVGLAGGYKTVNYKKATEDAVHKDGGGEVSDAYSIKAPSAMLQENSGKGLGAVPSLPQMVGGRDIPIEAGANAAGLAAMRSPTVTGFAPGVREGKQAELASLQSTLANPGPNANQLGSGPDYLQNRIGTLQDWLNKNNSQGGLVSQPGNFARGGLADGDYMNPALAYYSPQQAQQGVFQLQPAGQHQILRGDVMQAPPQKQQQDPIAAANQAASLALTGSKIYDWAKKPSKETGYDNEWAPGEENNADTLIDLNTPVAARGGLIAGRHHYSRGGINPYGGLGGNDILGPIIEQQDTSLRIPNDKGTPAPSSKPQQSGGLGELSQVASAGKNLYKGGEWAAGKLGLGEASPTAMSATSTEALPGGAGGVVPEAVAPVVPEAVTAAAPEALTAGLAGAETVAAPVAMAAAEGAADLAPLLFFLKNGGAVPRRHHFEDGGFESGTSQILPADPAFDPNFDEPQPLRQAPVVRRGVAPPLETTAVAATPRTTEAPAPRAREPVEAPKAGVASSYLPDFSKIVPEGAKDTLSSENFWVPAIAGIGSMLASPNKTLAGAIGSGLVGGTGAYTGLQKQQADIMKQRYDLAKGLFRGPVLVGNEWKWEDTQTGEMIPQEEYQRRQQAFITGKSAARPIAAPVERAPAPAGSAVNTAREVVAAPQERPQTRIAPSTTAAPQTTAPVIAAPPAAAATSAPAPQAAATAPVSVAQPLFDSADPLKPPPSALQIQQAALANDELWKGSDPSQDPRVLLPRVAKADREIAGLQAQADAATAQAVKAGERSPDQAKVFITQATGYQAQADRVRKQRDDDRAAAQAALDKATQLDVERAKMITQKQAELQMADPVAAQALKSDIAKLRATESVKREFAPRISPAGGEFLTPPGQNMPAPVAPQPTPEQAAAPRQATVDQTTGQLQLARPVAPAGGGHIPAPPMPAGTIQTKLTKDQERQNEEDSQFTKDFLEKMPTVAQARQRYTGLVNAFKLFESGSTESTRAGWAAVAQTFGQPDIARAIANGEPAGVQWVDKIGPNLVLDTLKAAQPRFAQSEFNTLQSKGTPEPNKLPQVNFQMVKEGLATLNRTEAFMHSWDRASKEEGWGSPSAYYIKWSQANPLSAFEKSVERQMGNFSGMPLPPAKEWTPGATYVVPSNLPKEQAQGLSSYGLKPGDVFRYEGPGEGARITPIPKQQLYSMGMGE